MSITSSQNVSYHFAQESGSLTPSQWLHELVPNCSNAAIRSGDLLRVDHSTQRWHRILPNPFVGLVQLSLSNGGRPRFDGAELDAVFHKPILNIINKEILSQVSLNELDRKGHLFHHFFHEIKCVLGGSTGVDFQKLVSGTVI